MQQGRQTHESFQLPTVELSTTKRIDAVFKQVDTLSAPILKLSTFPGDMTYNEQLNAFVVPFSVADTYKFEGGKAFYGEFRIYRSDSDDMPESLPFRLLMGKTIIPEGV